MDDIFERAGNIDNILLAYLRTVAVEKKYLPQAFRTCRGILSLETKYGLERLVAACACATEGKLYSYNDVKGILQRGEDIDFMPTEEGLDRNYKPQEHKNIRGKDYYSCTNKTKTEKNGNK